MKRWLVSFGYAVEGFFYAVRTERNMQIHLAAAAAVVALSVFCGLKREEWLWILLSIALVFSAECFNTAVERVVDVTVGKSYHQLAKAAKDAAAAAVLIVSVFALAVAALVLYPALMDKLQGW